MSSTTHTTASNRVAHAVPTAASQIVVRAHRCGFSRESVLTSWKHASPAVRVLAVLGAACVATHVLSWGACLLRRAYSLVAPAVKLTNSGKWAIVTGCTSGIGEAFARSLARRGLNLLLVARNRDAVSALADNIRATHAGILVEVCVIDLSNIDATAYAALAAATRTAAEAGGIALLVNNAGLCYESPEEFTEVPETMHRDVVAVNCTAVTLLARVVLPHMYAAKRGVVINVSSLSGTMPAPLLTTYGATKSYVNAFSHALSIEAAKHGVLVQTLVPGLVASKMSKLRPKSFWVPSAADYVEQALGWIGRGEAGALLVTNPSHRLMAAIMLLVNMLPTAWSNAIYYSQMKKANAAVKAAKERKQKCTVGV